MILMLSLIPKAKWKLRQQRNCVDSDAVPTPISDSDSDAASDSDSDSDLKHKLDLRIQRKPLLGPTLTPILTSNSMPTPSPIPILEAKPKLHQTRTC